MAMIGKYLNANQADLLASAFERIIYVGDNDEAGKEAQESVVKSLLGKLDVVCVNVLSMHDSDTKKKDLGDATQIAAWRVLQPLVI
jgi:DNA primase